MTRYEELNLKKLRNELGLDFAHYTYKKGQCSCCYGPKDMALKYWRNQTIPEGNSYKAILFKNADNGSGRIRAGNEMIQDYTCVEHYGLSFEERLKVGKKLKEQLDEEYIVCIPSKDIYTLIILWTGGRYFSEHKAELETAKDADGNLIWTFIKQEDIAV